MKKILSMLLVVVMTASLAIGGTVAFLTQELDEKTNMFTVGNIDVSLDEETAVIGEGGEVKDKVNDENEVIGAEYVTIMPGDYLKKEVTVENEGKNDAYVAVTVTLNNALEINNALDKFYEGKKYSNEQIQAIYDEVFAGWGINYNPRPGAAGISDARGVIDGTYGLPEHVMKVDFAKTTKGSTVIGATNWFIAGREKAGQYWVDGPAAYDGYYTADMNDYEIRYTYYLYLPAGEKATLFNGLNVPEYFESEQLAMFENLKIEVNGAAIQADNIPVDSKYVGVNYGEAKTAFEILAGTIDPSGVAEVDAVVTSDEELDAALKDGADVIFLKAGNYNMPDSAKNNTLTLIGEEGTIMNVVNDGSYEQCDYSADGSTVTFENLTIVARRNAQAPNYCGYARMKGNYNNCTIEGEYTLYGTSNFKNCTLNATGDVYNIWTWGADKATFNGCTFNSDGKAMLLYGTENTYLSIEDCTFNDKGGLTDLKAAIEIGNDYDKTYNLFVSNTVVNGYEINNKGINTGTTLWGNKNSMDTDHLNVVVDGVDVY